MNIKTWVVIIFACVLTNSNAQVAKIPFEIFNSDKVVLIKLKIGNYKDSLTFLFDTGAGGTLVDSATAAKIGLISDYEQKVDGASGSKTYKLVLNQTIKFSDEFKLDSTNLILDNLLRLQDALGRKIDGIIGYDILRSYKTKIDFDKQLVVLYTFNSIVDTSGYEPINFNFKNGIPIPQFPITITCKNGNRYTDTAFFDSGAGTTLILNSPFVQKNNIEKNVGKTLISESENLSGKSISQDAIIKSIKIGKISFGENCITLSSDKEGVSSYKGYIGILGSEIINRFNVILDYSNYKLFLKPNHLYAKRFSFPVSGITLKTSNSSIVISSVVKTSAAFKKGLRENQKIISINSIKTLDIETYRKILHKENSKVKIEYLSAEGKTTVVELNLKRLI